MSERGIDEFNDVLREFRRLSTWGSVGSVSIPFIAAFAGLLPPWPPNLQYITAVFQLAALIIVFQLFRSANRRVSSRNIIFLFSAAAIIFFMYIYVFMTFSIGVDSGSQYIIRGYACTTRALATYGEACPDLGIKELSAARFDEFELWTRSSIGLVRVGVIFLWALFFCLLTGGLAQFLVYQRRRKAKIVRP